MLYLMCTHLCVVQDTSAHYGWSCWCPRLRINMLKFCNQYGVYCNVMSTSILQRDLLKEWDWPVVVGDLAGESLGMGTTWEVFQSDGTFPSLSDWLNSTVTDSAIQAAVCFSIWAEIPSSPIDLLVSREARKSQTKPSSQNIVVHGSWVQGTAWKSASSSGLWDWLNYSLITVGIQIVPCNVKSSWYNFLNWCWWCCCWWWWMYLHATGYSSRES